MRDVLFAVIILGIARPAPAAAQPAESTESVVVTAPEDWLTDATSIRPADLGLRGNLLNISDKAANVSIGEAGGDSFADVYSVRGLANTPNFSQQALTIYVDGVPSVSTFTNFTDLGQLRSVEVLRGPQGDLVGKNAEAGLVEIETLSPGPKPAAIASATLGNYASGFGSVLLSGPVQGNTIIAKIEGSYFSRDGYLDNTFLGTRPDYQQHIFGRVQLSLAPTIDWQISLTAEGHLLRDGVQRFVPLDLPDLFRVAFNFDGKLHIDGNIESLRIARTFDSAQFTVILSARRWQLEPYTADFDYSPQPLVVGRFDLSQTQLAQEIRLDSLESERDWRWRIGAYVDRVTSDGNEIYSSGPFNKIISFQQQEAEFAAFGRITRFFHNGFDVTMGMRLDYDTNQLRRERTESSSQTAFDLNHSEWNTQPKLTLNYEISPLLRVYIGTAYSYRNGGYSFLETDPHFARFAAEHTWTNETGFQIDGCEHRLQLRIAAFVNRTEDYQVERLATPPDITVFNAPLVVACGGEMEATFQPVTGLVVRGSFGFTHSSFSQFTDPFTHADYSGNRTPFSPEFTASVAARYTFAGTFGELEFLASGQTFYDEANTAFARQAPTAHINLRIGHETGRLLTYFYGENLNDARYFTQKIVYAGIGTPAPPRTFGVAISIKL